MNEDILYKLWLNILCGHEPNVIAKCIEKYGQAKDIYNSDELYHKMVSGFKLTYRLKAKRSLGTARQLMQFCEEKGISIIPIGDKRYPKRLAEVYNPPQLLYVAGDMPDFDSLVCITMVGSRTCSDYSKDFAKELATKLAEAGVLIISGMALGIDSASHRGALDAGHSTVAVLAGGVDVIYPKENTSLYKTIKQNGAIISERPPSTSGRGSFYRERNRLLVGLSNGVVIVEGRESSGTKLTANWAINSDRDLFAVPGKPTDKGSELPNKLIRDSAKLITSAEDILEEYIGVYPIELSNGIKMLKEPAPPIEIITEKNQAEGSAVITDRLKPVKPNFDSFNHKQRIILEYLYNREATHIDDISRECGIEMTELSFMIIQLMMARAIKEHSGDYYSLSDSL